MDYDDSRGLLKRILGFFDRKPPEKSSRSTSLRSQTLDAWVRTDAYLQHETNDFEEIDPEQVARTLKTFENLVQYDYSVREQDSVSNSLHQHTVPYPKLQAVRRMIQRPDYDVNPDLGSNIRISKRKRENDAAIEELSRMEIGAKKRRVLPREEPNMGDDMGEPEADFAILVRKRLVSLHQGLRTQWTCVCQRCSGLSVRLSLSQPKKSSQVETCFEVFFGVRSLLAITLQEARITIKDVQNDKAMSTSKLAPSFLPEVVNICQCISESLGKQNCLNLLFEDGLFKRLHPQPKSFGNSQMSRTVSLSALFKRQQELRGGLSVLPLKGKRILAAILAKGLTPFLETPWVQPSFNHSKIHFFQPLQEELPDITKPFLVMEQVPLISTHKMDTRNAQAEAASSKHMVHPNASVLALGILLCELHYCTPVESWQNDTEATRNANTDYYTSLDLLKSLEVDASVDYYLATKACLQWEYFPAGELSSFESVSVQRLFYQNVVKRLESEIFKCWKLRSEDLNALDSRVNEQCWGANGREVVQQKTSKPDCSTTSNEELAVSLPVTSDISCALQNPALLAQIATQHTPSSQNRLEVAESSTETAFLFDASHHIASEHDIILSEKWMDNFCSSIDHHVDSFDTAMQAIEEKSFEPVRIAILDSGFDPQNSLLLNDDLKLDQRIKGVKNFVHGTEPLDIQDEIGHGTHALGLLLKVATCAEIYIARVANQKTLGQGSYDAISKARVEFSRKQKSYTYTN